MTASAAQVTDWFDEWFGEEYLALYGHRDEGEARRAASLIAGRVRLEAHAPALDLACGAGRHSRALNDSCWQTIGLDLSPTLLLVARNADRDAPLVRADMRELPFREASFAIVVNLFTSFGYFRHDAQHRRVVGEVARVVRPDGWFVLDYLNPSHVRSTLVPFDQRQVGTRIVEQEREISTDGRFVTKRIRLGDEGREFLERVRLFEPAELSAMFDACGFDVVEALGDYDGGALTDESPRCILFGRRRA